MVFQCINIRQVPWEVLKTAAFGNGFQHLTRDMVNVSAWKTMFDPYNQDKSIQDNKNHFIFAESNLHLHCSFFFFQILLLETCFQSKLA